MDEQLRKAAHEYHRLPVPGKIAVTATKGLINQRDLALAYTPGVASVCETIAGEPGEARNLTARGNLVAVITNGTAVLGLGAIGPLASKPVMEGKSVLFKKFAGIDVFDIEIDERDPEKLVDIIASLEPTFGGINLEDIKAPECFCVERKLRGRMKIPGFHDDQHGTAIIVGAAILNGLKVVGKHIGDVRLVASGAAALACLDLLVAMGMRRDRIVVTDIAGVVYEGRKEEMDPEKARYAVKTDARKLADVIKGADVFLGLSAGGVLKPEMVATMAGRLLILVLANPEPEILPELARQAKPDAVIATGRSDYPNQVNNVLCFPFVFRGALDVGATTINRDMELAAVRALAELAQAEQSDSLARPILIAHPQVIDKRIENLGLRLKHGQDFDLVDPGSDPRYREYWTEYHRIAGRRGVTPEIAKLEMRGQPTLIGAMLVHMGEADGMVCGLLGDYPRHLRIVDAVIGKRPGIDHYAAMNVLLLPRRIVFIADTYVNFDPAAEVIAETTVLAAEVIRRFGFTPRVALLSHSSFGAADTPSSIKMREAAKCIAGLAPELEVDGEMQGDVALSQDIRNRVFPSSRLKGEANLLVMPNLDAANIALNLLKTAAGDGITIGPLLLGAARPVHIVTPSATVRRIVNVSAVTIVDALSAKSEQKKML